MHENRGGRKDGEADRQAARHELAARALRLSLPLHSGKLYRAEAREWTTGVGAVEGWEARKGVPVICVERAREFFFLVGNR